MFRRNTLFLFAISFAWAAVAQDTAPSIDFEKARRLFQRERAGEILTAQEQDYLRRAKELRRRQQSSRGRKNQRQPPERLVPLTDMTADDRYEGEEGGLYGVGANTPPESLLTVAREETELIQPLDAHGNRSPDGVIGFVSISMSNATQEFSVFKKLADESPNKSSLVQIIDCAQGGQAMAQWVPVDGRPWQESARRLARAGVDPKQVQVAWVKLANVAPSGTLQEHGRKLESDTIKVLQNAKSKFPNLRIAYLGSRIWAGNAKGQLNPEPYAYESAFVVRWLIARQSSGDRDLTSDKSPLILWGPYLWAEGERGRKIDDLIWQPSDFAGDGVHPSMSGRRKVADQLLDFFTTDPLAKSWFLALDQQE